MMCNPLSISTNVSHIHIRFMYPFNMKWYIAAYICYYYPNHSSSWFINNIFIPNACVSVAGILNDFGISFLCKFGSVVKTF